MKYLRWLLLPFSLLYGLAVIMRNWFYDAGLFKSYRFTKPVISVGNLEVGGAGKSPMTEYLIRLLKADYTLATLSRGYGRKTKGYMVAGEESQESGVKNQEPGIKNQESRVRSQESGIKSQESGVKNQEPGIKNQESGIKSQESGVKNQEPGIKNQESRVRSQESGIKSQESGVRSQESGIKSQESAKTYDSGLRTQDLKISLEIGDEPAQFKFKFPDITVAVCEDRVEGLKRLMPGHDLVLMDDAYQHRAVEPGLSILLFDYNRISEPHFLLPAGNFREPFSGRWRANIIMVTKCPAQLTDEEKTLLAYKIEPLPYQQLFFTSIAYQPLQNLSGKPADLLIDGDTTVFLLTGIANPRPLVQYLGGYTAHIVHHNYPDHHPFTTKNILKLAGEYAACPSQKKIIVTTEKDAQRLDGSCLNGDAELPVFVIPISVAFLNDSGHEFDKIVIDYVREHTKNHRIH